MLENLNNFLEENKKDILSFVENSRRPISLDYDDNIFEKLLRYLVTGFPVCHCNQPQRTHTKEVQVAERAGAIVIQQPTRIFPAKGLAMKTGLRDAFDRSADIIVFLDADIRNLKPGWVDKLVKALIDDNCDMSRGFYTRHARDAAVTKLIARSIVYT